MLDISEEKMYELPIGLAVIDHISTKFAKHVYTDKNGIKNLYHYTDINGFHGITESKSFWASSIRFLNDYEEYSHGIDLCRDLIKELFTESISDDQKKILNILLEKISVQTTCIPENL